MMTKREKMNLSQASQANLETLESLRNNKVFLSMGMCGSKKDKILTFVDQKRFLKTAIENNNISVLLVSNDLYDDIIATNKECHIIVAEDPRQVFYEYHNYLARHIETDEIDTQVGTGSQISKYAYVADHGVIIGDRVVIEPNVTILPGVTIGDGSIIRSGSTIGVEGFELWNGLCRVPYFWEDDIQVIYEDRNSEQFGKLNGLPLKAPGLQVYDFHPIHIFLNTENLHRYESTRPSNQYPDELIRERYGGIGTRNVFKELLEAETS